MSDPNMPQGRRRKVTGTASMGERKDEALGTGPVGDGSRQEENPQQASAPQEQKPQQSQAPQQGQAPQRPQGPQGSRQGGQRAGLGSLLGGMLGGSQSSGSNSQSSGSGLGGLIGGMLGGSGTSNAGTNGSSSSQSSGSGLGSLFSGGSSGSSSSGSSSGGSSGGGFKLNGKTILILLIVVVGIFLVFKMMNNSDTATNTDTGSSSSSGGGGILSGLSSLLGGSSSTNSLSSLFGSTTNTETSTSGNGDTINILNREVDPDARSKYFTPKSKGTDTVTVRVYLCGTDLESRSSMATRDLQEMAKATFDDEKVKVIVYTGGCTNWHVNEISTQTNQYWRLYSGGKFELLHEDGNKGMTVAGTLSSFIETTISEYPASRYELILWDHGGGSVSGYGYDEKNKNAGTLDLAELQTELRNGLKGAKYANGKKARFDFIGFDACLMATVETALMAEEFADYLIASEETEPGIGWYYTNWLTALGENPSINTLDLGKIICDDFVSECAKQAAGQKTTLSIVDLAELKHKMPDALRDFSTSVTSMVKNGSYQTISTARNGAREFAASTQIDQVDLSDLAKRIGSDEANELADVIGSAVKYNRATFNGAYGLSIYFPYRKAANVSKAVSINNTMKEEENNEPIVDSSYSECIRAFASMAGSGAYVSSGGSGYNTAATALSGDSSGGSLDSISSLLSMFLGGDGRDLSGVIDESTMVTYLTENTLRDTDLTIKNENGRYTLTLPQDKWDLVTARAVNVFYYDAKHNGYVDLGYDNVYYMEGTTLVCDDAGAWVTLNGQFVAYYVETADVNEAYGYIPVLINGLQYELTTMVDDEGFHVVGARRVYKDETDAIAKSEEALEFPITIQPVFDFYGSDYKYQESYPYGNAIQVNSPADLKLEEMYVEDAENLVYSYRLTDIYQQHWWTSTYKIK